MENISKLHRRFTPSQRDKVLQAYRRSGLSQAQFAAQAGIGLSTLGVWLRQAPRPRADAGSGFVALPIQTPATSVATTAAYRIRLAQGAVLEVGAGFRAEELERLLRMLLWGGMM
jgi:transposase-like protein